MNRIFLFALLSLLVSCVTQEKVQHATLIAHAGGAVGDFLYTNSRESLDSALAKGYKYIELDLQFTSDSILVAAHSWEEVNKWTGFPQDSCSAPRLDDFKKRLIHGRYTPLTAAEINSFFMRHDSLFLVTDKVSAPEVLAEYFPELKERMVVEAFSYDHYKRLRREGYHLVLYSCMATDLSSALVKNLLFDKLFKGERIEWVSLHTSGLDYGMFKFLNRIRRFNLALFTVDSLDEIDKRFRDRARFIYTNKLLPADN